MTGDDVRAATEAFGAALTPVTAADWSVPAGTLTWSCDATARHVGDCLLWYAMHLAARTKGPDNWEFEVLEASTPPGTISLIDAAGALLADVVDAAPADARGWHPFASKNGPGVDPSGFAGMGCDEILVHGFDITTGLGVAYEPPRSVCARVVNRMFPWAPEGFDPWSTLLWCNGRGELPGHTTPDQRWLWHCEPLADWNGSIPT
jgi:uncharacterized protein (TIGR03083 family)